MSAGRAHADGLIEAHFDGAISASDEAEMRAHLMECVPCRGLYERHLALAELDPRALSAEDRIGRGLGFLPVARTRVVVRAGGLAFAAAAAAVLLVFAAPPRPPVQERGAPSERPELVVYRVPPSGAPERARSSLRASDELAFAVRNRGDHRRLGIFAVDEHGHVFWFHPAWQDAEQTPLAIVAPRGDALTELPEAVSHAIDGRTLVVHALFANAPFTVRDVEAALSRGGSDALSSVAESAALVSVRFEVTP